MAQRHCKNDPPTQADNYICIYYIVNSPLDSGGQRATNHADSTRKHRTGRALRSKSLLGRAPQPPAARNRCSGVPRSLLAFEITARAHMYDLGFSVSGPRSRSEGYGCMVGPDQMVRRPDLQTLRPAVQSSSPGHLHLAARLHSWHPDLLVRLIVYSLISVVMWWSDLDVRRSWDLFMVVCWI